MSQLSKKQIKQTEKQIIKQLTEVCHLAQAELEGFVWLTHLVDYQNISASLQIICVFESDENITKVEKSDKKQTLIDWIQVYLNTINIKLSKPERQIQLDSEQACEAHHQGNWERRLVARH